MIEFLNESLQRHGLTSEVVAGTLNVRRGQGPLSRAVNIDPTQMLEWLGGRPEATRRTDVASWANGVDTTLLEPKHSDARSWSYVEAAGSIFPTVEGPAYARGVRDATGGEEGWVTEIPGDGELVMGWILRLGRGVRPLTTAQVQDWGATRDRIVAAGRSLLFHSTRNHGFVSRDDSPVKSLRVGDGHDAARLWVVGDVFFTTVGSDWRFALPCPDLLLAVSNSDESTALAAAAQKAHDEADYPLDVNIWRIGPQGPVRA